MEEQKIIVKRIVAFMIAFMMCFSMFSPILGNVSFAAEDAENAIVVSGYFTGEGFENSTNLSVFTDVDDLNLNFDISVSESGYLKSGVLKFDNDLNFKISDDSSVKLKNNQLKLQILNSGEQQKISIPIEFERKDEFTQEDLVRNNVITFVGTYVDDEGYEHRVEKDITLRLGWIEETDTNISFELVKNLDYEKDGTFGKIIQGTLAVNGNSERNLPIRNTDLVIDIPEISGMTFEDAIVQMNRLAYTQGSEDFDSEFSEADYSYENGKLNINITNYSDDLITNSYGEDDFVVTFFYVGENDGTEVVAGNIGANIVNYSGNVEEKTFEYSFDISESIGNFVQYVGENKEEPISKGYLMADSYSAKYDIEYSKKAYLNVSRADEVTGIEIVDGDEYFVDEDEVTYYSLENDSLYKTTEFSRENLVSIFGEEGNVRILTVDDEELINITFDIDADENGKYVVDYTEPVSKLKFVFSNPVNDGNVSILNKKVISTLNYSRDVIKRFVRLENISEARSYLVEGISDDLGEVLLTVDIAQTDTNATLSIERNELSATAKNESVNFKINLNNNNDSSDLYESPVFEIHLPEGIREIDIANVDMFYANGEMEISNIETLQDDNHLVVRISVEGNQASYNLNKSENGTVISIDMDLRVDEFIGNITESVSMYYYNGGASEYVNSMDWGMVIDPRQPVNGYDIQEVKYIAPERLVTEQSSETVNDETEQEEVVEDGNTSSLDDVGKDKVSSYKQGAETELLQEGQSAQLATMNITVVNNTQRSYSDFRILGRTPFAGNKNILTGEDLGTTVDTIVDSEISMSVGSGDYVVYYSDNGEATADLYDSENNWRTDIAKSGVVKSYLIVMGDDFVLNTNDRLEFVYDYVIPANLQSGDAFYGTYATYFTETSTSVSAESGPSKVGYETISEASLEGSVTLTTSTISEYDDAEYAFVVKNNGESIARDVVVNVSNVYGMTATNLYADDGVTAQLGDTTTVVNVGDIEGHSEVSFVIEFTTSKISKVDDAIKLDVVVSASNAQDVTFTSEENEVDVVNFIVNESGINSVHNQNSATECVMTIKNTAENEFDNIKVVKTFSSDVNIYDVDVAGFDNFTSSYDKASGTLEVVIPSSVGKTAAITYKMKLDNVSTGDSEYSFKSNTKVYMDNEEEVNFNKNVEFDLFNIDIELVNYQDMGFLNVTDDLEYVYKVTNNSNYDIHNMKVCTYKSDNIETYNMHIESISKNTYVADTGLLDTATRFTILAGETAYVTVYAGILNDDVDNSYLNLVVSDGINVKEANRYISRIESAESDLHNIVGSVYFDNNQNKYKDEDESSLAGVKVSLYDSETNEYVDSMFSDVAGNYNFANLEDGNYYVQFDYDDTKYTTGSNPVVMKFNDRYSTDNISVDGSSVSNIDLYLNDDSVFDLMLDSRISKIVVDNEKGSKEYVPENGDLAKIDIAPDLLSSSKVRVEYTLTVTNQGDIAGRVERIGNYLTDGMIFDDSLNYGWYIDADGRVVSEVMNNYMIDPGEAREVKLVLVKYMTEENTGIVSGVFEILSAQNDYGVQDIDSSFGNKLTEDDISYSTLIIGVQTGFASKITPIVMVVVLLAILGGALVWRVIDERRYV